MHSAQRPNRWMVILAFGLVYLFWGSTYLAIDIAVQTIPPALMCALRFSVAGLVMLAVCAGYMRSHPETSDDPFGGRVVDLFKLRPDRAKRRRFCLIHGIILLG